MRVSAMHGASGCHPGFACCQAQNLLNPSSAHNQRIDLILTRGNIGVSNIRVLTEKRRPGCGCRTTQA